MEENTTIPDTTTQGNNNEQPKQEAKTMKNWEMDIIIAWGLTAMGVISIIGWIAYSIKTGNSNGTEIPMAIVSGLTGALAGRNTTKPHTNPLPTQPTEQNVCYKQQMEQAQQQAKEE